MREYVSDILIVGASFGGISAAIAACKAGSRVILTEETSWLGGQATSQGVPLDEHPWIEQYGSNESYRDFRRRIRHNPVSMRPGSGVPVRGLSGGIQKEDGRHV